MAYKINGTEVIDDNGELVNFSAYNLNNDDGQIEIQSNSPMVGTVSGYTSGGYDSPPGGFTNVIDKFPFSSDTNATDVGDLTQTRNSLSGQSSTTHGYSSGGFSPPFSNRIDKFSFATDTNASDVGKLSDPRSGITSGQSSTVSGYATGGDEPTIVNTIDKFPFATDTNATDIGDLTQTANFASGQSSTTHGYTSGGNTPPDSNVIDKFPFATDTNASDVGDLTQARSTLTGQSSTTHGYASGGAIPAPNTPPIVNTIEKFPFATDTNATDIADLTQARDGPAGQSSTASGYTSGGRTATPATHTNVIDKFPFATDTNATDVGDLTVARRNVAGQQD